MTLVSFGWDVGGWHGDKNYVAAIDHEGNIVVESRPLNVLDKSDLCSIVTSIPSAKRVVVGIDAPLRFPKLFVQLIAEMKSVEPMQYSGYINNRLAYRDTDRHIKEVFGKPPLSAAFDLLGNPATVAMAHIIALKEMGFKILPFDEADITNDHIAIEVYPALLPTKGKLKRIFSLSGKLNKQLTKAISTTNNPDAQDAYRAAFMALAVAENGFKIQRMHEDLSEGWIYYV